MADAILLKIKEAEQSANKSVSDAKDLASQILKEARENANSEYKRIISDANAKASDLIEKANIKAQLEKKPLIEKAKASSKDIIDIENNSVDQLVNELTERIIRNGNS